MRILLLLLLFCSTRGLTAQSHKIEYFHGETRTDRLITGDDYWVHVNGQSHSTLVGGCRNLTLELDGQSEILLADVDVTGNLVVQSINGGSHVRDLPNTYPHDTVYPANTLVVKHFDNGQSYISLNHCSIKMALLGHNEQGSSLHAHAWVNGEPPVDLVDDDIPICLDCASINGGGRLELIVKKLALGRLQGGTKVYFLRGSHPNVKHLESDVNCIMYRN